MTTAAVRREESGLTQALAEAAAGLRFEDIPAEAVEAARQCLLDWVGVTVAGAREPLSAILRAEAEEAGGAAQASVIGHGRRLPAAAAALLNGAAGHALDYDDVNLAFGGHPTAVLAPAVLALAQQERRGGRALIAGFVAGYEAGARIGQFIGRDHYEHGFHSTATVGSLAAAAACGNLMGLEPERLAVGLGIAATQAAGLKSMFGTMGKPFHAGTAARNGLLGARLAARGFTAAPDVLDCAQGFAEVLADGGDAARIRPPAHGWYVRDTLFKYHAACYMTHAAIEAAAALRRQHAPAPEQVAAVRVNVGPQCLKMCNIPEPQTGLQVKFSLRHTVAMALTGTDTSSDGAFSDAVAARPDLVALRRRVQIDPEQGRNADARVTLTLADGREQTADYDAARPAADLAAQREKLEAKFQSLVAPIRGEADATALRDALRGIDQADDLEPLARLL